jgi:hypothetical protein
MKRYQQKLIAHGLIVVATGWNTLLSIAPWTIAPATAQGINTEVACLKAINAAEAKIVEDRTIDLRTEFGDTSEDWSDRAGYPADRPQSVTFFLGMLNSPVVAPDGEAILQSPQLMEAIATDITNRCLSIGYVSFAAPHSDWFVPFGIINGSLKAFQCAEDWNPRSRTPRPPLNWGFYNCL